MTSHWPSQSKCVGRNCKCWLTLKIHRRPKVLFASSGCTEGALRVIIDACLLQDVFPGIWRSANIFLHLVGLCSSCYTSKYYRTSKDPESFYINRNQYIMGEPDSGTISRPLNRPLIHQESSNLPQWGPYTLKKYLHFLYNCNAIRL